MILILSNDTDYSTFEIIDWLDFYEKKYIRVYPTDYIEVEEITVDNEIIISIKGQTFNLKEIQAFWYRRGHLNHVLPHVDEPNDFKRELNLSIKDEYNYLTNFIYKQIENRRKIGSFFTKDADKLQLLNLAKVIGLKIPETIVTTSKKSLILFFEKYKEVITKPIGTSILFNKEKKTIKAFTSLITENFIQELPEFFAPSLFQRKIDKKYELRVFYLKKSFYSMAIFSQADPTTSIDFRNYNIERPNRNVPFTLPEEIKNKLLEFMQASNLDTGSIDIIVDKNNEYYFLEVNPIGQFGMVSYPCNYQLEKKIAEYLSFNNND